ncbi:Hypothetical protein KQS_08045 [Flavobacterium indicum GPTSA100-9 = DSM 17447]|uniref:Uncharacterized protein n=1 Tax=Flavobacterium indicum (strain DSM 17447 / CIP 109464 / GPTSA100-9) TaxID=1094466 RepID=H8XT11_FLAIG|nr:Hypothetical protein KQS_08045 [Flavobacterium indicum GPTSA100-9 = DSM 17447]
MLNSFAYACSLCSSQHLVNKPIKLVCLPLFYAPLFVMLNSFQHLVNKPTELVCLRLFYSLESASIQENLNQVQVDKLCGQTLCTNYTQSLSC